MPTFLIDAPSQILISMDILNAAIKFCQEPTIRILILMRDSPSNGMFGAGEDLEGLASAAMTILLDALDAKILGWYVNAVYVEATVGPELRVSHVTDYCVIALNPQSRARRKTSLDIHALGDVGQHGMVFFVFRFGTSVSEKKKNLITSKFY